MGLVGLCADGSGLDGWHGLAELVGWAALCFGAGYGIASSLAQSGWWLVWRILVTCLLAVVLMFLTVTLVPNAPALVPHWVVATLRIIGVATGAAVALMMVRATWRAAT